MMQASTDAHPQDARQYYDASFFAANLLYNYVIQLAYLAA